MVNDLTDTHHHKPKLALRGSKSSPMTHVIDNPLDDFSNSDDQTNHITTPTGNTSLSSFHTKRQMNSIKWHDSNYFENENKIFIPKLITQLHHFIHQQYKIQLYLIVRLSIQLLMTTLLITHLPIMTMMALSKYNTKQIILSLHHLFRPHSLYFPSNVCETFRY